MKTKNALSICIFTLFTVNLGYARWPGVDPHAENYYPQSPYAFCNNNPIRYVDPNGKTWVDANGNAMWKNGQWTKSATPDAMRVGVAMRATEIGRMTFDQVANDHASIQVVVSPDVVISDDGATLTRGDFTPTAATLSSEGQVELQSGVITIYEGSIAAEVSGDVQSTGETATLIKSLPKNAAIDGAIGSVAVHEGVHATPKNIKQQYENRQAEKNNLPKPHNIEKEPEALQNRHLQELRDKL